MIDICRFSFTLAAVFPFINVDIWSSRSPCKINRYLSRNSCPRDTTTKKDTSVHVRAGETCSSDLRAAGKLIGPRVDARFQLNRGTLHTAPFHSFYSSPRSLLIKRHKRGERHGLGTINFFFLNRLTLLICDCFYVLFNVIARLIVDNKYKLRF